MKNCGCDWGNCFCDDDRIFDWYSIYYNVINNEIFVSNASDLEKDSLLNFHGTRPLKQQRLINLGKVFESSSTSNTEGQ